MATLTETRIAKLLQPYLAFDPPGSNPQNSASAYSGLYAQLSSYLDLLLKWNVRTNLTAIREPEEIVRRHFGESLFASLHLANRLSTNATLLDFGSGAGFPGLPIQLLLPELRVTLAESQGKKASFLREAVRTLNISTEVWDRRVEIMPLERKFGIVTLRAVDNMEQALAYARLRVTPGGWLVTLSTAPTANVECIPLPEQGPGWLTLQQIL